jgi:hypothetical protein
MSENLGSPIHLSFYSMEGFSKPTGFAFGPFLNESLVQDLRTASYPAIANDSLRHAIAAAMTRAEAFEIDGGWEADRFFFSGVIELPSRSASQRRFESVMGYTSPAKAISEDIKLYVTQIREYEINTAIDKNGELGIYHQRSASLINAESIHPTKLTEIFSPDFGNVVRRALGERAFGSMVGLVGMDRSMVRSHVGTQARTDGFALSGISPNALVDNIATTHRRMNIDQRCVGWGGDELEEDRLTDLIHEYVFYNNNDFKQRLRCRTHYQGQGYVTLAELREVIGVSSNHNDGAGCVKSINGFSSPATYVDDIQEQVDKIIYLATLAVAAIMPQYGLRRLRFDYKNFYHKVNLTYLVNNSDLRVASGDRMDQMTEDQVTLILGDAMKAVDGLTDRMYTLNMDIVDGAAANIMFAFDGEKAISKSLPLFALSAFHPGCNADTAQYDQFCRDVYQMVVEPFLTANDPSVNPLTVDDPDLNVDNTKLPWNE